MGAGELQSDIHDKLSTSEPAGVAEAGLTCLWSGVSNEPLLGHLSARFRQVEATWMPPGLPFHSPRRRCLSLPAQVQSLLRAWHSSHFLPGPPQCWEGCAGAHIPKRGPHAAHPGGPCVHVSRALCSPAPRSLSSPRAGLQSGVRGREHLTGGGECHRA